MLKIILVEDDVADCQNYYLSPLKRFAAENPDLCGDRVEVEAWIIGESNDRRVHELEDVRAHYSPILDVSVKHSPAYEKNQAAFLKDLKRASASADLVLVDRSARGRRWIGSSEAEPWADVVANELRSSQAGSNVVVVSDETTVRLRHPDYQSLDERQLVHKFRDLTDEDDSYYYGSFARAVALHLRGKKPSAWKAAISPRAGALKRYLRAINGESIPADTTIDDLDGRRESLFREARHSLMALLSSAPTGPTNLNEATPEREYAHRKREHNQEHRNALRRLVLYGLEMTWWTLGPGISRKPDPTNWEYILWVETAACECTDYHNQIATIDKLATALKAGKLQTNTRKNSIYIPLAAVAGEFTTTKGQKVDAVQITPADPERLIPLNKQPVWFIDGILTFWSAFGPAPRFAKGAAEHFRLSWPSLRGLSEDDLPTDKASGVAFWAANKDATPIAAREGNSVFTRSSLAKWNSIGFSDLEDVFTLFQRPAPHERLWWFSVRQDVINVVEKDPVIWQVRYQSEMRAKRSATRTRRTGKPQIDSGSSLTVSRRTVPPRRLE